MLAPLALAFQQIQILQRRFPPPMSTDLFVDRPASDWSGVILAVPLAIWLFRRLLGVLLSRGPVMGSRAAGTRNLDGHSGVCSGRGLAGQPRLVARNAAAAGPLLHAQQPAAGALPDIQIIYFGQIYEYSLPWHNAWVLMGITVPSAVLAAAAVSGSSGRSNGSDSDRLPLYFLIHLITLPVIRMFETPAHDGVRLFLPAFFFLAAFAGWGAIWLADMRWRAGFDADRVCCGWPSRASSWALPPWP